MTTESSTETTRQMFQHLFWPAAAGNVAWSFFQVAISPGHEPTELLSRLTSLSLLAGYLAFGWYRFERVSFRSRSYYRADGMHLVTIAAFAVATAERHPQATYFLAAVFAVAATGHLFGSFDRQPQEPGAERLKRAGANLLGIAVMVVSPHTPLSQGWGTPLALGLVLLTWRIVHGLNRPDRVAA